MSKFFQRIALPVKLTAIGVIPLACLLVFAVQVRNNKQEKTELLQDFRKKMHQAAEIMELIDGFQAERRYSFNLAVTDGEQPQLYLIRKENDERIRLLAKDTDGNLRNFKSY